MKSWELQLVAGMLSGTVIVRPCDLDHLRRLERESPQMHAQVMRMLLRAAPCDVDAELVGLVWRGENRWHHPAWRVEHELFKDLPTWFRQEYCEHKLFAELPAWFRRGQ